jgi:hypothetical protein
MIPTSRTARSLILLGALFLGPLSSPATAQWSPFGTPLTTAVNIQDQVSTAPDGAGGMIVAWRDQRTDAGDIYVQRVSGTGFPLWTPGGVPVCTAANQQLLPQIVTDGEGGAILAWQDNRTDPLGDIYAQRVDRNGTTLWIANGVPLVTGASENVETVSRFRMIPDGVGGAIFTFSDNRFGGGGFDPGIPKVWAERVTAFGSPLWSPGGLPVAAGSGSYENASLAPDGYGGIIVAWADNSSGDWNITAQHLNPSGVPQWGGGVVLCSVLGQQLNPEVVSDGSGGAVVAWQDDRVDANGDIFAQRVNASGAVQWLPNGNPLVTGASANNFGEYIIRMILNGDGVTLAFADDRKEGGGTDPGQSKVWAQRVDLHGNSLWGNGVPVAGGPGTHTWHRIVSDTDGGVIVVWQEGATPSNTNVFAQRLNPAGSPLWGPGVSVCNALGQQSAPAAIADGLGGVLSAWTDARTGTSDVYAQYVDFSGVPSSNARWQCSSWLPNGAGVSIRANLQSDPAAAPDGAGGAIIAWRDEKSDTGDVYVQRMSSLGVPLWTPGGVPVCVQPGLQQEPRVVPDGIGGAIIVWQDNRVDPGGDLAAQRVDALGNVLWAVNGVPIISGPSNNVQRPSSFRVVSDGVGGVILTFQDSRRPDGVVDGIEHVWAQRVDGSGSPLWGNGVPVSTISGNELHGALTSDGAGGAIVTWSQVGAGWDILGQRIDFTGARRWGAAAAICTFAGDQSFPEITTDGDGGAVVSWVDFRADVNGDIYAQRMNPGGGVFWVANGVPLVTGATHNSVFGLDDHIRMISDNAGGAFLSFIDTRDFGGVVGAVAHVWAQRADAAGGPDWGNGIAVAAGTGSHFNHSIVTDGEGGSVIVWQENPFVAFDIRAQRMKPSGGTYWVAGGVLVTGAPGSQTRPAVTEDGRGHAIAAWSDARSDVGDIYAERVCVPNGTTTGVTVTPTSESPAFLSAPVPNPTGNALSYTITVTRPGQVRVVLADVQGRVVATLLRGHVDAGSHTYTWSARGQGLATGVYFLSYKSAEAQGKRKLVLIR